MRSVIIRPQYGAKTLARRLMQAAQEGAFIGLSVPSAQHRNAASVFENEGRDIDGITKGVLRQPPATPAIDVAAIIGAHGLDADNYWPIGQQ